MRILAIWDNEAECDLVSMYLGIDGNEVTSVAGVEQVELRLEEGGEFDIILMPIDLPEPEAGFAVFKRIREIFPGIPGRRRCYRGASGRRREDGIHGFQL